MLARRRRKAARRILASASRFSRAGASPRLFGPSGAGKTTHRQHDRRAGDARSRPHRARRRRCCSTAQPASICRRAAARIGYVFQEGRLFPHLSMRQQSRLRPLDERLRATMRRQFERVVDIARHRPPARPPARQAVGRRAPARRRRPRAADAAAPAAARRAAGLARRRHASWKSCPISSGCATRRACR